MPPTDSMFMLPEDRRQPMHVGGLQLFHLPEGADQSFVSTLYDRALAAETVAPLFRKRPHRSAKTLYQWTWVEDDEIDLEHHLRHSALPQPGRVRELLALVSRLHGALLDRTRPLWETHLIEGLEGNRFAVYTKQHHALMDGVSGMKLLQRSLSESPDERTPLPFEMRPRRSKPSDGGGGLLGLPGQVLGTGLDAVGSAVGLTPRVLKLASGVLREQAATLPGQAPKSMLNVSISSARRFAGDAWPLDRIRAVANEAGATVNDVVLAMCSGALRAYMLELDALPEASLVAMTPVSLRGKDDEGEASGNAVGTILCNLATDEPDPARRLEKVRASMLSGKEALSGLNQLQATALSAAVMAPLFLARLPMTGWTPPPFNLVISNVPGPKTPLYYDGARMEGMYPLSIPIDGQALNITVTSYDDCMQFGLTGCRRSVPHLQRLLGHLEDSLVGMEKAV